MDVKVKSAEPSSKDDVPRKFPSETNKAAARRLLGLSVLGLTEDLAWNMNAELRELRVTKKDDGWLVMVKAKVGHKYVVSFFRSATYGTALEDLSFFSENGMMPWRPDKFPPRT